MHTPGRGEGALRRHRVSISGTSYFLTISIEGADANRLDENIAFPIRREIGSIESDAHWQVRAAAIMPDHTHLLVQLTGLLPLSRCVARLKSKTRPNLSALGVHWQRNFYEHRLRPDDSTEAVLRYIFLNPHRANLGSPDRSYPWFWLGEEERSWFMPLTLENNPFPEWLR
jgi:REP element-mobilizing transposase RayT